MEPCCLIRGPGYGGGQGRPDTGGGWVHRETGYRGRLDKEEAGNNEGWIKGRLDKEETWKRVGWIWGG